MSAAEAIQGLRTMAAKVDAVLSRTDDLTIVQFAVTTQTDADEARLFARRLPGDLRSAADAIEAELAG